jgi:hypothetical protein
MPIDPALVCPDHALCVYAEPLAAGRRVVVVGDASLGVGALLASLGARVVHIYDPNADRARAYGEQGRGVAVRPLPPEGFEVRDGAFDLAIVPDLASASEPAALLGRLRRLVGPEGAVLVAARNPDVADGKRAIPYEELYDMVALQFESVRMIGEVPFTGVTLAELGEIEEEAQVSVDTQLGPEDRTPYVFIALGSQEDLRLDPYALVQLPRPPFAHEAPRAADDDALRAVLAEQTLRAELLERQLEDARQTAQHAAAEGEGARQRRVAELQAHIAATEARSGEHFVRAERLAQEVSALEEEVARLRERAVELEEQASDYKRMRAHAEVELTAVRASFTEVEDRLAQAMNELEITRAAADVPQIDPEAVARLAARADVAEARASELETDIASIAELHAEELAQLEGVLRERARSAQVLEQELLRRERLVKELVTAVEEASAGGPYKDASAGGAYKKVGAEAPAAPEAEELAEARREAHALRDKLDRLALELARREGEIEARGWKVAELEERLAMASKTAPPAPQSDPELARQVARAQSELDVLRQALAQEHEARARVESGEALAKAHAELARQATLIEQLSRELDARDRRPHAAPPE